MAGVAGFEPESAVYMAGARRIELQISGFGDPRFSLVKLRPCENTNGPPERIRISNFLALNQTPLPVGLQVDCCDRPFPSILSRASLYHASYTVCQ